MYKRASASLQRKHRVVEVRHPVSAYVNDDDLIPSADNMTLEQCLSERQQLMVEKVKCEQELGIAKRNRDTRAVASFGARYQTLCSRLGLIGQRVKAINRNEADRALRDAIYELLDEPTRKAVFDRATELIETRRAA